MPVPNEHSLVFLSTQVSSIETTSTVEQEVRDGIFEAVDVILHIPVSDFTSISPTPVCTFATKISPAHRHHTRVSVFTPNWSFRVLECHHDSRKQAVSKIFQYLRLKEGVEIAKQPRHQEADI